MFCMLPHQKKKRKRKEKLNNNNNKKKKKEANLKSTDTITYNNENKAVNRTKRRVFALLTSV